MRIPRGTLADTSGRRFGAILGLAVVAAMTRDAPWSPRLATGSFGRSVDGDSVVWPLTDAHGLTFMGLTADPVSYRGRRGLHVTRIANFREGDFGRVALFDGTRFHNGTIELEVAGTPSLDADTSDRGFVGLVFRSANDGSRFESFYIRATNGRADDPVRRSHAVQYQSSPEYPWFRLRKETPLKYEAHADFEAGAWTALRVVVRGTRAELFVNNSSRPSLRVTDLKLGDTDGLLGLWVGPGTDAHFRHVTLASEDLVTKHD